MLKPIRLFCSAFMCVFALAFFTSVTTAQGVDNITWPPSLGGHTNGFVESQWQQGLPGQNVLQQGMRIDYCGSSQVLLPSGFTFTAPTGHQTAGQYGASVTDNTLNRWVFDYHIFYSGGLSNLDSITLSITSPLGNTVTAPVFDMRLAPNDNVTGSHTNNPAFFIQGAINPSLSTWFTQAFNTNVVGTYIFDLHATLGNQGFGQTMHLEVIPAPSTAAIIGLGGIIAIRRRRR